MHDPISRQDTISRQATLEALLDKGQRSRRYKLGDIWELNFDEIREVINGLPAAADPSSYALGYTAGLKAGLENTQKAVLKLLYALPPEEAITKAMLIQSVKQLDTVAGAIQREERNDS